MVANHHDQFKKPSDFERLQDLKESQHYRGSDTPVTISASNFNWLLEKAGRWIKRVDGIHEKSKRELHNWSEKEMETMKVNGLTTNNAATRICRGWTREDAVNIPKITEKGRQQRVVEGAARYYETLEESE